MLLLKKPSFHNYRYRPEGRWIDKHRYNQLPIFKRINSSENIQFTVVSWGFLNSESVAESEQPNISHPNSLDQSFIIHTERLTGKADRQTNSQTEKQIGRG